MNKFYDKEIQKISKEVEQINEAISKRERMRTNLELTLQRMENGKRREVQEHNMRITEKKIEDLNLQLEWFQDKMETCYEQQYRCMKLREELNDQ